ncbi:hypothetical protein [Bacteroides sp. 224]|uniref:hypothetical protein n=1 Tax=Bacteroides sp. 224 TaxID=2302936 RepID=UPI0013D24429|nr:hypothetical protein [Bacteroides sp. 224]NDV64025.1 hypothetical protein [Bacteroides sp. 224]
MIEEITSKEQYDHVRSKLDDLIAEATKKGLLEPEMDNEYTQKIGCLSIALAKYEDNIYQSNKTEGAR